LFAWLFFWPVITAADDEAIDRSLRRQPAYGAKPQYCLLLFGPEGKTRVWLVVAGEALYADTSGAGDLRSPEKRLYSIGNYRVLVYSDPCLRFMWFPVPENVREYNVGDVFDPAARRWYHLTVRRLGSLQSAFFEFEVDVKGQFRQLAKLARLGDQPKNAPVLHFSGPLTLGLFTSQWIRGPDTNRLEVWIGTKPPALTKGEPTYLVLDDWIPPAISPIAQVEFPAGAPSAKPIHAAPRLTNREGLVRFSGRIHIPEEAGLGKAKIRLTIPSWKGGVVQPAAVEIPVVAAPKDGSPQSER
jgi:hypothetical protein